MRKCFPTWASKYVVNMDNTGRIGKPQKSRKAKKIKSIDPFYKGDRKDSRIKHKDQRPISDDTQEFPQKVRRMMEAISHADQPGRKRRRQKGFRENDYVHPGMTKALDAVPQFKKKPGESEFRFMGRVERETQAVLQQSKLERKYKMKFERDEAGDLVPVKTGLSKQRKKRLKERKQKKKLQKQEKRRETDLEFGALKDEVKFGEVVTQPPTLTAKPRKGHALNQTKPGQRSLLLKSMMSGGGLDRAGQAKATVTSRKPGETVKRKLLSPAQRVITDAQRQSAIDLYRQLKDKKVKPV